ncbi:MAG: Asp-tRNA(Asn)/Glu-tRNA(Gln) amidotransferase subunit GatC [Betaproteobacteria bacterium]|nr:Asp-tRNA(Asn)/Glu-tRNA(Gln) amidotransferase subunit GatC [Pseudomonadota bacterium]NBO13271.1 Asp-tRNA(Asn)/Glu-tRNA(Gln) amidotransferase subunit GatC [Betaproteobacteria bacterium]NBO45158.1 Asp-tRNA(Asn)/Glu-tRNA(Gln) amidotransferase subunit GatC [Betaproteobacteria bacterium]NBP11473.1 Asp-tRNA(Asn)/Glu-tRNA(Gln) amidotransferase subunit GatC [Betaproteobacteria bacterium]NBP62475.1 Asp-tRNA(Asn)/Glu-tRNA(Gln) amidotransferase subunit GatC [Betaproteobacteria bacterium]
MTHLTEQDIRRLARLARLELPENELGPVRDKLNAVIALIDRLQAVDTGSVAAMSHPHDPLLRLRDDLLTESDQREALQAVAPKVEDGLYLVPRVID